MLATELSLGEGKPLTPPKMVPADKDALKAHTAALQTAFEDLVKSGCQETKRFNASFVPATYLICHYPERAAIPSKNVEKRVERWDLFQLEGTHESTDTLATNGDTDGVDEGKSSEPFELMSTSRGWFTSPYDDNSLVYILFRNRARAPKDGPDAPERVIECRGKRWSNGSVHDTDVPDFPARSRDVDGDGTNEYPAALFSHHFRGVKTEARPAPTETCNLAVDGRLELQVVGAQDFSGPKPTFDGDAYRPYYEHRLAAARARAKKVRAWAGLSGDGGVPKEVTRAKKIGTFDGPRFTNACAIDVAQIAADLIVYARTLGTPTEQAFVEADALMQGFALKLDACSGLAIDKGTFDVTKDAWPTLRDALAKWTPPNIGAPPPGPSASAAPSTSASAPKP